jgi:hypothetical protein
MCSAASQAASAHFYRPSRPIAKSASFSARR